MNSDDISRHYGENRQEIENRLEEFEELRDSSDYRLFMELCFVILTSQSSAKKAWKATEELDRKNLLLEGDKFEIAEILREHDIQYEENKAGYILKNRKFLSQPTLKNPTNELKLREKLEPEDLEKTREWLVDNIKGISWKGASHFLRNVGYGDSFAIISNYISRAMFKLELIEQPDTPENREEYLDQEEKLRQLSQDIGIDIKTLDLVLWSMETGEVFK